MSVNDTLFATAEPLAASMGLQLVETEFKKEGPRYYARVYLTKPEGVSLDDCHAFSKVLEEALDQADAIGPAYHLEVSSPGAERVLKTDRELSIFQGKLVKVTLKAPDAKKQAVHYGLLGAVTPETVTIDPLAETEAPTPFSRADIQQIRLALRSSVPTQR